jgi:hypothetical protein
VKSQNKSAQKECHIMTIKELKSIINSMPDETILLIDSNDNYEDVETIFIEHHSDGRTHIVFSALE